MNGEWKVIPDAYGTVQTLRDAEAGRIANRVHASADEIAGVLAADPRGPQPDRPACYGEDPELFFPPRGGSVAEPRRICAGCLLRAGCLEFAMDLDIRYGVFGGLTAAERQHLKWERIRARQVAA